MSDSLRDAAASILDSLDRGYWVTHSQRRKLRAALDLPEPAMDKLMADIRAVPYIGDAFRSGVGIGAFGDVGGYEVRILKESPSTPPWPAGENWHFHDCAGVCCMACDIHATPHTQACSLFIEAECCPDCYEDEHGLCTAGDCDCHKAVPTITDPGDHHCSQVLGTSCCNTEDCDRPLTITTFETDGR